MTNAELKARKLISERTTEQLVSDFELTDRINDVNISTVRGWIMDELEKRDSVAFDKWIDAYTDSPREFFLG